MEQLAGGITFAPVLARDLSLSSDTILPAYSPLWLPAATHNEGLCRVSLGRKTPWSADGHPEVFHRFLSSLPLALTWKDRKNSITAKIQGEQ